MTATTTTSATTPADASEQARSWVDAFAEGWRAPGGADRFCDHFEQWLDPDIRLIQPVGGVTVGHQAFREDFARPLFKLVPDLHGTVEGWAANGDTVYVELRLDGTIGRRPFTMHTCDRVKLRDGRAIERVAYLDPTPMLTAIALSPRSWPRAIPQLLAARRRSA
jgi:ketosteroid isomerase-like protein